MQRYPPTPTDSVLQCFFTFFELFDENKFNDPHLEIKKGEKCHEILAKIKKERIRESFKKMSRKCKK